MLTFLYLPLSSAIAEETEEIDLFDLSLEELLSTDVTTASKSLESVVDAPGIISTISAKEIRDFGARNLFEVLSRAPSTSTSSSKI